MGLDLSVPGAILVGAFVIYLWKNHVYIPANHCALVEGGGTAQHPKVLTQGHHWLAWPVQRLAAVDWSYVAENEHKQAVRRRIRSNVLNMCNQQLDSMPSKGLTGDRVEAFVNGTLHWRIVSAKDAIYKTTNLLGFLTDCVDQATRRVLSKYPHAQLVGIDQQIATQILEEINELTDGYGIVCSQFLIQGIEMNERLMKVLEEQMVSDRKTQVEMAKMQHFSQLNAQKLEFKTEHTKRQVEAQIEEERLHHEAVTAKTMMEQQAANSSRKRKLESELECRTMEDEENAKRQRRQQQLALERINHEQAVAEKQQQHVSEIAVQRAEASKVIQLLTANADLEAAKLTYASEKYQHMADAEKMRQLANVKTEEMAALIKSGLTGDQIVAMRIAPHLTQTLGRADKIIMMDGKDGGASIGTLPWMMMSGAVAPMLSPAMNPFSSGNLIRQREAPAAAASSSSN